MGTVTRALATLALALVPDVCAARSCDDVVFLTTQTWEAPGAPTTIWQIIDLGKNEARTLLRVAGYVEHVQWDSSFSFVAYQAHDSLYRMDWRFGGKPEAVFALPSIPGRCDIWFDADRMAWQAAAVLGAGEARTVGSEAVWDSCRFQVWHRSRETGTWAVARAAVGGCDDGPDCRAWENAGLSRPAHVRWYDLIEGMLHPPLDETVPAPTGELPVDADHLEPWYFLPSSSVPTSGVAFRALLDIEEFPYLPLYFVDRRRQTSRLLFGTPREVSLIRAYLEQRCGLLLFTTLMDPTRLIDLQTGEVVRLLPSDEAVWVRRPRD